MDYAQTYFGKPLTELQFADIEHFFIDERQESDQLEFKSYPSESADLDKALAPVVAGITAFLNSSGGLLIWGAPRGEKVSGRKEKAVKGAPTKLPLSIEKDSLIGRIADKIIPLPRGIRVQLVSTTDGQIAVFEIDESPYSPHQTGNTYYMRIDGASRPAPHHYIEALFKKVSFPKLEAYIKVETVRKAPQGVLVDISFLFFNFSQLINEEKLSFQIELVGARFYGGMPEMSKTPLHSPRYHVEGAEYHTDPVASITVANGFPYTLRECICFPQARLKQKDVRASISLIFNGKSAPAKFCRYHLVLHPNGKEVECNVNKENKLLADMNSELGRTDRDILDELGVVAPKGDEWYRENWPGKDHNYRKKTLYKGSRS